MMELFFGLMGIFACIAVSWAFILNEYQRV